MLAGGEAGVEVGGEGGPGLAFGGEVEAEADGEAVASPPLAAGWGGHEVEEGFGVAEAWRESAADGGGERGVEAVAWPGVVAVFVGATGGDEADRVDAAGGGVSGLAVVDLESESTALHGSEEDSESVVEEDEGGIGGEDVVVAAVGGGVWMAEFEIELAVGGADLDLGVVGCAGESGEFAGMESSAEESL